MANDLISEQQQENKKLEAFVGKWQTSGEIYNDAGEVTGKVNATDTYEWLPGYYAMIHYVDSKMDELKIHGIEIIGYDPSRKAYYAPFFDDQGSVGWEEIQQKDNTWIWNGENVMGVKYHRCIAIFTDKNTIAARHEHSPDNKSWNKWMDITLRKQNSN